MRNHLSRAPLHALLAATLLLASCATGRPRAPAASTRIEPSSLIIRNNHWSDVTIWVMTGGQRNRLGTVTAARSARFTFPRYTLNYSGEVRLIANALADARPLVTETIVLRPGSVVEWTLESSLQRSSLAVY